MENGACWGCAKAKTDVVPAENPELCKVPSFKPGVGWNITLQASPAVGNSFFMTSTFPFHSTASFFFSLSVSPPYKILFRYSVCHDIESDFF